MKKYIKENWNTFMFGVTTAVIVRFLIDIGHDLILKVFMILAQ